MNRNFKLILKTLILACYLVPSCSKDEGIGGKSSITGKVIVRQYNANFTYLQEEYAAPDEDVFIIYGDDPVYGDKVTTNYDGNYRFEYLQEGTYSVYAYSEDSAKYPTQHKIPIIRQVKVGKNQVVQAEDIVILK
jgi:hypothetical protein